MQGRPSAIGPIDDRGRSWWGVPEWVFKWGNTGGGGGGGGGGPRA